MPVVPFESLPESARAWVFASDRPLAPHAVARLLPEVERFLELWRAHGVELRSAYAWRDDRFLLIGVDESATGASGCSIDGLFRGLRALEPELGASLVGGGRVYYRNRTGAVESVTRDEFSALASSGAVSGDTTVFDTSLTTVGDVRRRFETTAGRSWHAQLVPAASLASRDASA